MFTRIEFQTAGIPHLLGALLLLMGWLNADHFGPWVSWHSEIPVFIFVLALAAIGVWRGSLQAGIELPLPVWLFIALSAVLVVQFLVGLIVWKGQFWVSVLYLLLAAASIAWAWTEVRTHARTSSPKVAAGEWLAWTLIIGGILSLGLALVQVFQVWDEASFVVRQAYVRRPGGNLAQPNHLATLLVMAVGAAYFLCMQGRLTKVMLGVLVLFFAIGVAITESRSGLLSIVALCGLSVLKWPPGLSRAWPISHSLAAVSSFLFWPSVYSWSGNSSSGGSGLARLEAGAVDPRWALWQQMLDASTIKPWFGWGFRNTAEAHNAIAHQVDSALPVTYSHNLLLDLAVWVGWPIALMVLVLTVRWLWRRRNVTEKPLGWFGMTLLVPFGIHSAFEFPFAYAYLLVPAMLGAGYVEGLTKPQPLKLSLPRWLMAPVVTAAALLGAWSVGDYIRAEEDFRVARFQMLRIGPAPTEPPPQLLLLDQLGDLLLSMRVPLQKGLDAAQMKLLREAALHYPWSGSQYRYAAALALNGAPDEATRQLKVLWAQQGYKVYRALAAQLDQDLVKHGLPALGVLPEKLP